MGLLEVPTKQGSTTIYWGAIPLKVVKTNSEWLDDNRWKYMPKLNTRSDLIQRLRANECELCGARGNCDVHHVRKLADLKRRWQGRREAPLWVQRMIAMQRKTLIVCPTCHVAIHKGAPIPKLQ